MASPLPSAMGHMASYVAALGPAEMPAGRFRSFAQGQHFLRPVLGSAATTGSVGARGGSVRRQFEPELPAKAHEITPGGTAALGMDSGGSALAGTSRLTISIRRGRVLGGAGLGWEKPFGRSMALLAGSSPLQEGLPALDSTCSLPGLQSDAPRQSRWTKSGQLRGTVHSEFGILARAAKGGSSKATTASPETPRSTGVVKKGALVEFDRDGTRTSFAVVQRPDGKSKWITMDQHGNVFSIKPQQVTYVVPTNVEYTAADIITFLQEVDAIQDSSLLELAWSEMVVDNKTVNPVELAELLYMSSGPAECYAAHRMLSSDKVYFKRRKGTEAVFEPRPAAQVEELRVKVAAEEVVERERRHFVDAVRAVLLKPRGQRSTPASWQEDPLISPKIAAIRAYALELSTADKKLAEESLESLGVARMPSSATDLLLRLGVLPRHLNVELLRSDVPQEFRPEVLAAAEALVANPPPDLDEALRVDLTHLKVYTIDSEDTEEIDDGLSVEHLEDGRLRLWVHVADPARWIRPRDVLDTEAKRRGTSVYLCTGKLPMFPLALAAGPMSLRQGERCCAMSVGAILHRDGSLAEAEIVNSHIEPTFRLTYEDVEEIISLAAEEEPELSLLAQMAVLRHEWRMAQGAVEISMPETDLKVVDPEADDPKIALGVADQSTPARRLVAEMMILSGEAVARFGGERGLPMPYRGQAEPNLPEAWELEGIPPGPCTAVALRRCMTRSESNCSAPIAHASLGLPGYVQFTSPIRRYGDMLAHYQVKATLRGEELPFGISGIEAAMTGVGLRIREARRQENAALRYWLLEHLRRQPKGRTMEALILRYIRDDDDSLIGILIHELGYETVMRVTRNIRIGETIEVVVVEADPRRDILWLQEAALFESVNSVAAALAKHTSGTHEAKTSTQQEPASLDLATPSQDESELAVSGIPEGMAVGNGASEVGADVDGVVGLGGAGDSSWEEERASTAMATALQDLTTDSGRDLLSASEGGDAVAVINGAISGALGSAGVMTNGVLLEVEQKGNLSPSGGGDATEIDVRQEAGG